MRTGLRRKLAAIAADTLKAVAEGGLDRDVTSDLYQPGRLSKLEALAAQAPDKDTKFEVLNETSLQGARRLVGKHQRVGVLNFASAKNPGGGFLGGAWAQEESLARSSALYPSLLRHPEYYRAHDRTDGMYSDRLIYTRRCPVIRDDEGNEVEQYEVDFITCAAPNLRAYSRQPYMVEEVIRGRSSKLLAAALHEGCDALVLGAWGCGVFGNNPEMVATAFHGHLSTGGAFHRKFEMVLFSVLDDSQSGRTIEPFRRLFR